MRTFSQPPVAAAAGLPIRRQYSLLAVVAAVLLAACGRQSSSLQHINSLQSHGKSKEALQLTEKLLSREPGSTRLHGELLLRRIQLLEESGRLQEALESLSSPARTQSLPPDLRLLLLRELAAIEKNLGRFEAANQHLLEALALARSSGQAEMATRLNIRRAYVLIQLHRLDEAQQCLAAAQEYSQTTSDHSFDPYILNYRGQALGAKNQFEEAIPLLEASLQGFRQQKQDALAAEVTVHLAWYYFRLGQIDRALELDQKALRMAKSEDFHLIWGNLANMLLEQHSFDRAADYSKKAIETVKGQDRALQVRWRNNLAVALLEQGKWKEAEPVNRETLVLLKSIEDPQARALALVNQGRLEAAKGDYHAAELVLQSVAESGDGTNLHALDAYSALAELYQQMNRPGDARRQLDFALSTADRNRARLREDENKITYLSKLTDIHRQYVDFLLASGDRAGAFSIAESSRARLLRERLDLASAKSHHYAIAQYQAAARKSGATFLSYWVGPEHSYLWAISGNRFDLFPLPPEPEIRSLVERYQRAVERDPSSQADDVAAGTKLFQVLLPADVLKPGGRYLIVPDGPLYALNFETLPVPGARPHYWIEDATVAVAPSLDLLLANQVQPSPGRSLLLVGDANEWNPQYPKLLHAKKEMADIEQVFPPNDRKVLAQADATAAAYLQAQPADYNYIHFTAHATANKNSPFDSAIILSRENGSSAAGKLSAKEVLSTRVRAELVTISACHSAGARTYWGEGLVGFAWAFLQSGAHGVIAGLWDVSDYSSPRLMHDLYAGLAASASPADALRAAKLNLIGSSKYADPYYWGAFQLYQGALYAGKKAHPAEVAIEKAELIR